MILCMIWQRRWQGTDCFRIENGQRRQIPRDVRHLFLASREMATEEIFELKNLRTLIIHDTDWYGSRNQVFFQKVFEKLRKLRVLIVAFPLGEISESGKGLEIPTTIGDLKHLRYLHLKSSYEFIPGSLIIPRTLTLLHHLQGLTFDGFGDFKVPPYIDVGKLSNLRHISMGDSGMTMPNIARLTSLQSLDCFRVGIEHGHGIEQLRDLNKIQGHLSISDLVNVKSKSEALEANLGAKTRLAELELQLGTCLNSTRDVQAEVLEGLCPPRGLKSLEIRDYNGLVYPSWMVGVQNGGPKYLNTLVLCECSQLGPAPELFECFVHLSDFTISGLRWDTLPHNVKDLRWLKRLAIGWCFNIKSLPELPRSLEQFLLFGCDTGFMESCQQVDHPNWQKLQHVKNCRIT
ncbi:unnamed protein product [Alopecurus aequalis]